MNCLPRDSRDLSEDSQKCLQFVIGDSQKFHSMFENHNVHNEHKVLVLLATLHNINVIVKLKYVDFGNESQNMAVAMFTDKQYFPLVIMDKNNMLTFFVNKAFQDKDVFKIQVSSVISNRTTRCTTMTVHNEAF